MELRRHDAPRSEAPAVDRPPPLPRRSSVLPWLLLLPFAAFTLGLVANPWFEREVRALLPEPLRGSEAAPADLALAELSARLQAADTEVEALKTRIATLEARPASPSAPQPALNDVPLAGTVTGPAAGTLTQGERLARLETRFEYVEQAQARLDERAQANSDALATIGTRVEELAERTGAAEGAGRTQAALLVAAARRAIEHGDALGPLEPALVRAFGREQPGALSRVVAIGRSPVGQEALARRFDALAPELAAPQPSDAQGWQARLRTALAGLVNVERAGGGDAVRRLVTAASARLDRGDVAGAIAAVERLPPGRRAPAEGWLADARRLAAALAGLERLETAALSVDPAAVAPPPATVAPPAGPAPAPGDPGEASL